MINISVVLIADKYFYHVNQSLMSIYRAIEPAKKQGINTEIIIVSDESNTDLRDFIEKKNYPDTKRYYFEFKNTQQVKSQAEEHCVGEIITTLYAGNLFSENWLVQGYNYLLNNDREVIAHPEFCIFLENNATDEDYYERYNNFIYRQMVNEQDEFEIDDLVKDHIADLISIFRKKTREKFPYELSEEKNYDFKDNLDIKPNNTNPDLKHCTVKNSLHFIRKDSGFLVNNKVYDIQHNRDKIENFLNKVRNTGKKICFYGVGLLAHELVNKYDLSGVNIAGFIDRDYSKRGQEILGSRIYSLKDIPSLDPDVIALSVLKPKYVINPLLKLRHQKKLKYDIEYGFFEENRSVPEEIFSEWKAMNQLEPDIFPSKNILEGPTYVKKPAAYPNNILKQLSDVYEENYSHIFIVRYILSDGSTREVLNFIEGLVSLKPDVKILMLSTDSLNSTLVHKLPQNVKFVDLKDCFDQISPEEKLKIIYKIVMKHKPEVIHNYISQAGFDLFINHREELSKFAKLYSSIFCFSHTRQGFQLLCYPIIDLYKCSDQIISDNRYVFDQLQYFYGLDSSKLFVHYQSVEKRERKKYINKIKDKKSLDILWAGRLDFQKRPDVLYNIAVKCKNLPFKFHVWGHTFERNNYIRMLKLLDNVVMHGGFEDYFSIPLDDVDIFLNNSQWEGLPNILLEVMSSGLPIISSDVCGIPEVIRHRHNGLLVGPYDNIDGYVEQLQFAFENSDFLADYVENSYEILEKQHSKEAFKQGIKRIPGYIS